MGWHSRQLASANSRDDLVSLSGGHGIWLGRWFRAASGVGRNRFSTDQPGNMASSIRQASGYGRPLTSSPYPPVVLGTSRPPADQAVIDAPGDAVPLPAETVVCQVTLPDQGLERWFPHVHRIPHLPLPTMTEASADETQKRQNDLQTAAAVFPWCRDAHRLAGTLCDMRIIRFAGVGRKP